MDLWEIRRSCFEGGYTLVCGADEAGPAPAWPGRCTRGR